MTTGDSPENKPFQRIGKEKQIADKGASWLNTLWPWAVLIGGPTVNSLLSPAVAEQSSMLGVFFSTLAFSSGVAAFFFIVITQVFGGMGAYQYMAIAALCLLGGSILAVFIGYGSYAEPVPYGKYGTSPPGALLPYLEAAIFTFGPLGVALGGASGILAGWWAARIYKANA